jgi:YD repeat-containing protein
VHSQSEGGVGALDIVYDSPTQTTVTNSRGVPSVYTHDSFSGLVTASNGPGCASCGTGGASTTLTYDRFLNLTERIDGRGIHTQMPSYDAKGNVLTRIEAVGTPLQRTTTFTYHPTFNFVATTTVPSVGTCGALNKVATNTYDPNTGDLMQRQVTGCNDTAPFTYTTAFTYDAHGQLRTTDGPRNPSDVSDITTNDYYPDADPDPALRGRLMRRTDALGHQVTHAGYDLFGNVGSVTDGNAVVTTFIYDSRDRLLERRIHGASAAEDIVTINT